MDIDLSERISEAAKRIEAKVKWLRAERKQLDSLTAPTPEDRERIRQIDDRIYHFDKVLHSPIAHVIEAVRLLDVPDP